MNLYILNYQIINLIIWKLKLIYVLDFNLFFKFEFLILKLKLKLDLNLFLKFNFLTHSQSLH